MAIVELTRDGRPAFVTYVRWSGDRLECVGWTRVVEDAADFALADVKRIHTALIKQPEYRHLNQRA